MVITDERSWHFDCDGTIAINAEEIHERCVKQTLESIFATANMKLPETFESVWQAQLGKGIANFYNTFIGTLPEQDKIRVSEICANSSVFEQQYEDYYCDLALSGRSGLQIRNGVREQMVKARAEGEPVTVISNAKDRVLRATLGALGIDEHNVDLIAGIDTVMKAGYEPKPAGGSYLFALDAISAQRGKTYQAKYAVGMEDSSTGFESLRAAGFGMIIYCNNHDNKAAPDMAHLIVGLGDSLLERLQASNDARDVGGFDGAAPRVVVN